MVCIGFFPKHQGMEDQGKAMSSSLPFVKALRGLHTCSGSIRSSCRRGWSDRVVGRSLAQVALLTKGPLKRSRNGLNQKGLLETDFPEDVPRRFQISVSSKGVLPQRCSAHFWCIFDANLTDFWRILDVPPFPIKQDPFWRISDAFLTHSGYCRRLFPKTPFGQYRKSQIASDLKSRSPNRKNFPQIAVSGSSKRWRGSLCRTSSWSFSLKFLQFCRAESWEFWAEVLAEFFCSECPSKTSPKTSWKTSRKTSAKTSAKTSPWTAPSKAETPPKTSLCRNPLLTNRTFKLRDFWFEPLLTDRH